MLRRLHKPALALGAAFVIAGCTVGSTNASGPPAPSTTTSLATTTTAAPSTTTNPSGVTNLKVTDQIRAQLLDAGAASKGLSPSDFTGLVPGKTYYAFDSTTSTYWAGAGLVPAPASYQAGVANQDEGAYLIFQMRSGGTWSATATGLNGALGSPCPVQLPAGVLAAWNWPAGTCAPPGGP